MSATNVISNPFPLGLVVPGASFASISVPITANYADIATSSVYGAVDTIYVSAPAGNGASIYFMNSAAAPDTTAYSNILFVIAKGTSIQIVSSAMNTLMLSQFFIGAAGASDGAIVTVKFR